MYPWIYIIVAYLTGSVTFGVIVSKLFSLADPRTVGSCNPGATNVMRSGKKAAALLTIVGDAGKGWLVVWLAQTAQLSPKLVSLCALAVFLGHLYPVFYKFQGGKGVATAAGILLAISPILGLAAPLIWVSIFALTRTSSLSALTTALIMPGLAIYLMGFNKLTTAIIIITLLLIWRHKSNIEKLLLGTEPKFGTPRE